MANIVSVSLSYVPIYNSILILGNSLETSLCVFPYTVINLYNSQIGKIKLSELKDYNLQKF
ncbi:hypothetical protein AN1V17_43190 [Vallitalea sediminicola]